MAKHADIRIIRFEQLTSDLLNSFSRYQVTTQVKYLTMGSLLTKEDRFIDDWDWQQKQRVIRELRQCIATGGYVVGAFEVDKLIGFASIEGHLFGPGNEYVELSYLHVSKDQRNGGVGQRLFNYCRLLGEKFSASKLYIAAHPAVETQNFYARMGCTLAAVINQDILAREPLDIQLEALI